MDFDEFQPEFQRVFLADLCSQTYYRVLSPAHISAGGFVVSLAAFGQIFLFLYTAERQVIRMRLAFYRNIMRQEMAWFDANSCGEMTVKLTE